MLFAMVREGHKFKVKGSTVWQNEQNAQKHLDRLMEVDAKHWQQWKVKAVNADWELDAIPHEEYPDNKSWRSLIREVEVIESC